jgi:hypothetical protein
MSDITRSVNVHHAYHWECPVCRRDYFGLLKPASVSSDEAVEIEQIADQLEIEGDWLATPKWVNCPVCDMEFEVNE